MKTFRTLVILFAAALLGSTVLPNTRADEWDKKTIITFSQPVEIPGKVLPAGTYTFKLLESPSDRHIVQIFNADGTQLITTVLAINNYRMQPTGETVVKFTERAGDAPEALRGWFYPGDNFGQEFVYPKARATQLAQNSKGYVPSVSTDYDDNTIKTTPISAQTPDQKEVEVGTVIQTTPNEVAVTTPARTEEPKRTEEAKPAPEVAATPTPAPTREPVMVASAKERDELPQTASSMPLIALLGGLSIGLAFGLKLILKLAS
jgi:hypothetical protein